MAQNPALVPYSTPLPQIDKKGKITMPDGKTLQIEHFKDKDATIFFVTRHAEKDTTGGTNADLNPIGRGRAVALRHILEKVKINRIYSTDRPRTKNTAEPTAKLKRSPVQLYDAKKQAALLTDLAALKGHKYLIVGHSNTVHAIVNHLMGNETEKEFSESDYSRLYIVSVKKIGTAKTLLIRY